MHSDGIWDWFSRWAGGADTAVIVLSSAASVTLYFVLRWTILPELSSVMAGVWAELSLAGGTLAACLLAIELMRRTGWWIRTFDRGHGR